MDAFSLDDFENSPPPPQYLYKYLSAERVGNVLEGGMVRFTPLMNTNDPFEVRSTFEKLVGPKFIAMLSEQMDTVVFEENVREMIAAELKNYGLGFLPIDVAVKLVEQQTGQNLLTALRTRMQSAVDTTLVPTFNDPKNIERLLETLGRELLCFSLSERMDVAPMWANYADNNGGFVVAFDTEHEWFQNLNDGKKTRLQKVTYFDGKVEEPLANVQAALISKTTDWEHEREWRLYVKEDRVDKIVGHPADPIHLLDFPPDAVNRVILGPKTRPEIANRIRDAVADRYPHAPVMRAVTNRRSHTYDEVSE